MRNGIWQDVVFNITPSSTTQTYRDYEIRAFNKQVYVGRGYRDPEGFIKVRANDIVAGEVYNRVPTEFDEIGDIFLVPCPNMIVPISIYSGGIRVSYSEVTADWSYIANSRLNDPINGHIDPRMPLVFSCMNDDSVNVDGYAKTGDFSYDDYNEDYHRADIHEHYDLTAGNNGNVYLNNTDVAKYQWVVVSNDNDGELIYKVMPACHRYALYYVNAYGGVDFLLMEGNCKRSEDIKRYTHKRVASTGYDDRAIVEDANVQDVKYRLKTGLLTSAESEKMHHLIGATEVFLYDCETREMRPVVITDTECDHKTYKSEGNRLVQYIINVQLAQERMRR